MKKPVPPAEPDLLQNLQEQDQLRLFLVEVFVQTSRKNSAGEKQQFFVRAASEKNAKAEALALARKGIEFREGKKVIQSQARAVAIDNPWELMKKKKTG